MSIEEYVGEDGRSAYAQWHVSDLVPKHTQHIRLVFVFESPHVDELRAGTPVVGDAGLSALD
jgi:uracil-DNA glycosylase